MKATLTFNLPEEEEEHRSALDGAQWKSAVEYMRGWLRDQIKYHNNAHMEAVRDELIALLEERNLTLD